MSKKLDELFETYAYDSRQKTQLRLADEKGLDISKMKDPKFNWGTDARNFISNGIWIKPRYFM